MVPYIILHNSISIDGSLFNFEVNMEDHYQIAGKYKPDAHLIGSNTAKMGFEMYGGVTKEDSKDFIKPKRDASLPYWVIPDTKAKLKGMLHACRSFEFCKDVIILISNDTPKQYIKYLEERNYDYYIVGTNHINIDKSLEILENNYNIKTILTDTGQILGNIILNRGLVSEISLLIHPVIVGNNSYNIFSDIKRNIKLELSKYEIFDNGFFWLIYKTK